MGDWDFLYEMSARGYGPEQIQDAAGCGVAPWQWEQIDREWLESQFADEGALVGESESFESREGYPYSILEQTDILLGLVGCAVRHFENTGRYLQIWGELGELYAEVKFGLCRHRSGTAGSDGIIDGRRVEVKTISPEKGSDVVLVKSQGDFEKLLIIRIDRNFEFQGRLFDRDELQGGNGKFLKKRFGN